MSNIYLDRSLYIYFENKVLNELITKIQYDGEFLVLEIIDNEFMYNVYLTGNVKFNGMKTKVFYSTLLIFQFLKKII